MNSRFLACLEGHVLGCKTSTGSSNLPGASKSHKSGLNVQIPAA